MRCIRIDSEHMQSLYRHNNSKHKHHIDNPAGWRFSESIFCVHLFCAPNSNGVGHLSPAIHTNQQQAEAFPTTLEAQMMGMQCILEKKTIK